MKRTGSSTRLQSRLFRVLRDPACPASFRRAPPVGFRPSSRPQPCAASARHPCPAAPSATFRTSSTVSSAPGLAGLFHPAATSRVRPSGVFPPAQWCCLVDSLAPSPLSTARCRRLPSGATDDRPDLEALHRTGIRLRSQRGLATDRIRSPPGFHLLRVSLSEPNQQGHRWRRP